MAVRDRSAEEDQARRNRRPRPDSNIDDRQHLDRRERRQRDDSGSGNGARRGDAPASSRRSSASDGSESADVSQERSEPRQRQPSRLSADQAAERAVAQIARLTSKEPETVTGLHRSAEGWTVAVEVVEDRRIPSSSDILGVYEVELDSRGDMTAYRRSARYPRGRTEG